MVITCDRSRNNTTSITPLRGTHLQGLMRKHLPFSTYLWAMLLPQGGNEPLDSLVLDWNLIHVQVHAVAKPQLLQLLEARGEGVLWH